MVEKKIVNESREIAYYIAGNKAAEKALFFFNGLYVGNTSWIKQQRYKYFSKNYRMVFVDYPGMGNSKEFIDEKYSFDDIADCIKEILVLEKIEKCSMVGFSIGGMLALWFYHRYPECFENLVLLNTGAGLHDELNERIQYIMDQLKKEVDMEGLLREVYPFHHAPDYLEKIRDIENRVIEGYVKFNKDDKTLLKFFDAIGTCLDELDAVPEEIKVPTLVIGADGDKIFPCSIQEKLAERISNSQYCLIKNCGHSSSVEKYEEVNKAIEMFLEDEYMRGKNEQTRK